MKNYITQKEALEVLRKTKHKRIDNLGLFTLRFLMNLNSYALKKLDKRLYTIFEIVGVNAENADVVLSYTISNIEVLSKKQ